MNPAVPKTPSRIETRLSLVILAILVIVGGGVFMRQFHIHPAVLALRPDAQQAMTTGGSEPATIIDAAAVGVIPFSPPEQFTPQTLYEKIDGRADLYLATGFVRLATQRFTSDRTAEGWVEVFIYDMATPENAYSVFSMQRREDARPFPDITNAYQTPNALFMYQDRYYLELIGADASEGLRTVMEALARHFAETHGGSMAAGATGSNFFPEAGLDADSLRLIATNAFGDDRLDRMHTADYRIDGLRLTAFVSERENAQAAAALADSYRRTLLTYGAEAVAGPPPVAEGAVLRVFDTVEIIFSRGKYLAGIHEAADPALAADLARRLADHLDGLDSK